MKENGSESEFHCSIFAYVVGNRRLAKKIHKIFW
jgi:hypothetical protein